MPAAAEFVKNLFEETFGDVLLVGNGLDAHDLFAGVQAQHDQGAQCVFPSHREFHFEGQHRISTCPVKNCRT
jgi:hypothetical protein